MPVDTLAAPIAERLAMYGIDEAVMDAVAPLGAVIRADLMDLMRRVEARLDRAATFSTAIGPHLDRLREAEFAHVIHLFESRFDERYLASARSRKVWPLALRT